MAKRRKLSLSLGNLEKRYLGFTRRLVLSFFNDQGWEGVGEFQNSLKKFKSLKKLKFCLKKVISKKN